MSVTLCKLLLTVDNFFVALVPLMLLTEYASLITRKGQLEASLQQGDLLFRKNLSKMLIFLWIV